jgi:hypothetical protein
MKKWSTTCLLGMGIYVLTFSFDMADAGATCSQMPSCTELGYGTAACAEGERSVLCPFDTSYRKCIPQSYCDQQLYTLSSCPAGANCASCNGYYAITSCKRGYNYTNSLQSCTKESSYCHTANDGDFFYSDNTCSSVLNPSKTVIGVVASAQQRLVIGLTTEVGFPWASSDESNVNYLEDSSSSDYAAADMDGEGHTVALLYDKAQHGIEHLPASYCHNLTLGNKRWFLPSAGQVALYNWNNMVFTNIVAAGGIEAQMIWTSSEASTSSAWYADEHRYAMYGSTRIRAVKTTPTSPAGYSHTRCAFHF